MRGQSVSITQLVRAKATLLGSDQQTTRYLSSWRLFWAQDHTFGVALPADEHEGRWYSTLSANLMELLASVGLLAYPGHFYVRSQRYNTSNADTWERQSSQNVLPTEANIYIPNAWYKTDLQQMV